MSARSLLLWKLAVTVMTLSIACMGSASAGPAGLTRTGQFFATVPAPESVIGFVPGVRPVRYHEALAYYQALAAASERVQLHDYGTTYGGRRLVKLTISAPENLARLDTLRVDLQRLGDGTLEQDAARVLIANLPATAWMGYGIHGNEISGPDAALELVYRLAAGDDAATRELLRSLVIHVDPMFNVDGHERTVSHLQAFTRRVPSEERTDLAYEPPWPNGRGNHYLFDLNRDALYSVQQEARFRVAAILDASPQLLIDAHEMRKENTFLFAVPAAPLNPWLPDGVHASWQTFAADHSSAFDRDGTSFYTRSWNEVFYPGYFNIWPAYHGAVPILYEQASTAGATLRLMNGKLRTYAEAVEHPLRSSLANLQTAASCREALLTRWWQARRAAMKGQMPGPRAWLILPADEYKWKQAASTLLAQRLTVERLRQPVKASGLRSMWSAERRSLELPAGTLLVRATQPLGAVAHNLLDLHVPMPAEFLRQERRRLDVGRRSSLYDTTAWSLPHAYGADVWWAEQVPSGQWERIARSEELVDAGLSLAEARYGYLYRDPSLLVTARLLQQGVRVRVAQEALVHAGRRYPPGTMLIRNDDQTDVIAERLREQQQAGDVTFVPVDSARILDGPDLGDETFLLLRAPRIAVLGGEGLNAASVGQVMHLLDVSAGVPFTLLEFASLKGADLSAYDVIVMPDVDSPWMIAAAFNAGALENLRRWVDTGGTLIGLRGGADAWVAAGVTAVKPRRDVVEKYPPVMFGRSARTVMSQDFIRAVGTTGTLDSAAAEQRAALPVIGRAAQPFVNDADSTTFQFSASALSLADWLAPLPAADALLPKIGSLLRRYLPSGAYLGIELRPEHWLTYGAPTRLPSMFRESDVWIAEMGAEAVARYAEPRDLAMSGLVWPEALGYIAGTAHLVRQRSGAGQWILFANDPLFRGYSLGTQRLFMNAALLGSVFK